MGGDFIILDSECEWIREMDAMRMAGKGLFGSGYLLSSSAAMRVAVAKNLNSRAYNWELSQREKNIIKRLNAQNNTNDNST